MVLADRLDVHSNRRNYPIAADAALVGGADKPDETGAVLTRQAAMVEQQSNLGILYVDVIVSSPAHEPAGDDAASPGVRDCLSSCQNLVIKRRGSVVKTNSDGAMYAFPDADLALLAAREMQLRVHQNQAAGLRDVSIRIGLHFGLPITAGVAAQRVALLAGSGQIFTTGETLEWLSAHQRETISKRVLPSRTKPQNVTVYEVMWQTSRSHGDLPAGQHPIVQGVGIARLRLIHLGRETVVDSGITIGRRATHDIALRDPRASRDHAHIERRQDKFVLVDHSTHGTFVSSKNGQELRLLHGELVLQGSGVLSFACPAGQKDSEVIQFWCDPADAAAPPQTRR